MPMRPLKLLKSKLLLSAAVLLGGFSFVYSAPGVAANGDPAKPAFDALAQISSPISVNIPQPVVREAAPSVAEDLKAASGGSDTCTPNPALKPGTGFSPGIDDQVRVTAITDLLSRIAGCRPLPYSHDGIVNNNSEGHMPQAPKGFYKEYTLMVPGRVTGDGPVPVVIGGKTYMTGPVLSARGPERIIIGGGKLIYYTMDHYATFVQLAIVK